MCRTFSEFAIGSATVQIHTTTVSVRRSPKAPLVAKHFLFFNGLRWWCVSTFLNWPLSTSSSAPCFNINTCLFANDFFGSDFTVPATWTTHGVLTGTSLVLYWYLAGTSYSLDYSLRCTASAMYLHSVGTATILLNVDRRLECRSERSLST